MRAEIQNPKQEPEDEAESLGNRAPQRERVRNERKRSEMYGKRLNFYCYQITEKEKVKGNCQKTKQKPNPEHKFPE